FSYGAECRLTDNRLAKVAGTQTDAAAAAGTAAAAAAANGGALAGGFAVTCHNRQDLAGIDVDDAGRDGYHGSRLASAETAESAGQAAEGAAADIGVLIISAELGDAADDDRVDAQKLADFG